MNENISQSLDSLDMNMVENQVHVTTSYQHFDILLIPKTEIGYFEYF